MGNEKVKEIAQRVGITLEQVGQVLTELVKAGVVQYSPGFTLFGKSLPWPSGPS